MAKKSNKTPQQLELERQYKLAVKALRERISYQHRKHGITIAPFTIETPEKITRADIEKIRGIRGKTLTMYADPEFQQSSDLGRQIIVDIQSLLNTFDDSAFKSEYQAEKKRNLTDTLKRTFNEILENEGFSEVSTRLEHEKEHLEKLTKHLMYGSDSDIQETLNVGEWLATIYGRPLTAVDQSFANDIVDQSNIAYDMSEV